ncbi:MAG: RNA-guided pseudouridylation complex pseudouridine synthase subunit Cbf5 [Methanobacteriota archaeon]|nr:MAG: RNA-guided pseudouridylation complex pseudouridine synthase subunit Cbf5 [Euryarchaeota archaeon]
MGKRPEDRTVEELVRLGVINLDKPSGPTSHQVSAWVKKILNVDRAGHGGTLDPRVTGVLPVALMDSTRALHALLAGDKEYVGVLRLHQDVDRKRVEEVFSDFQGEIFQMPPVRSAVKRELRKRTIYELDLMEMDGRDGLFSVRCESGTYIRTLCNDVGEALGIGGHMKDLRRTRTASFTEKGSRTLQDLKDAWIAWESEGDDGPIREVIQPMERLLDHLPKVLIKDTAVDAICHGADLAVTGISSIEGSYEKGQLVAVFSGKGEGVAIGKTLSSSKEAVSKEGGLAVDTKRVLMEPGTYPKHWKTSKKSD